MGTAASTQSSAAKSDHPKKRTQKGPHRALQELVETAASQLAAFEKQAQFSYLEAEEWVAWASDMDDNPRESALRTCSSAMLTLAETQRDADKLFLQAHTQKWLSTRAILGECKKFDEVVKAAEVAAKDEMKEVTTESKLQARLIKGDSSGKANWRTVDRPKLILAVERQKQRVADAAEKSKRLVQMKGDFVEAEQQWQHTIGAISQDRATIISELCGTEGFAAPPSDAELAQPAATASSDAGLTELIVAASNAGAAAAVAVTSAMNSSALPVPVPRDPGRSALIPGAAEADRGNDGGAPKRNAPIISPPIQQRRQAPVPVAAGPQLQVGRLDASIEAQRAEEARLASMHDHSKHGAPPPYTDGSNPDKHAGGPPR